MSRYTDGTNVAEHHIEKRISRVKIAFLSWWTIRTVSSTSRWEWHWSVREIFTVQSLGTDFGSRCDETSIFLLLSTGNSSIGSIEIGVWSARHHLEEKSGIEIHGFIICENSAFETLECSSVIFLFTLCLLIFRSPVNRISVYISTSSNLWYPVWIARFICQKFHRTRNTSIIANIPKMFCFLFLTSHL